MVNLVNMTILYILPLVKANLLRARACYYLVKTNHFDLCFLNQVQIPSLSFKNTKLNLPYTAFPAFFRFFVVFAVSLFHDALKGIIAFTVNK